MGVVSKGIPPLKDALINEPEDHLKAASAWSLGQIGRHSPDHARALAEADVLRRFLAVYLHQDSSEDLKTKSKRALKSVVQKIQEVKAEVGSKLRDYIDEINHLYPPEIVNYYSPNYAETLLKKMDEFAPTS